MTMSTNLTNSPTPERYKRSLLLVDDIFIILTVNISACEHCQMMPVPSSLD